MSFIDDDNMMDRFDQNIIKEILFFSIIKLRNQLLLRKLSQAHFAKQSM